MKLTAKQLSGEHIGKTITVTVERFPDANYSPTRELTGMITELRYTSNLTEDTALCSRFSEMQAHPDALKIRLDNREWVELDLKANPEVTIQEGQ